MVLKPPGLKLKVHQGPCLGSNDASEQQISLADSSHRVDPRIYWPGVTCTTATPSQVMDGWDSKDTSSEEPATCIEQSYLALGAHEALLPLVLARSTCIPSFCHILPNCHVAILLQRSSHPPTSFLHATYDEEAGKWGGGGPPIWYSLTA